jgi:hypothetical protein
VEPYQPKHRVADTKKLYNMVLAVYSGFRENRLPNIKKYLERVYSLMPTELKTKTRLQKLLMIW